MVIHISIDDVIRSLQRIGERDYQSIYDDKFFWFLRVLHRMFGMEITLYVYLREGEWSLKNLPIKYKQEFEDANDWLKFGFHAVSEEQKKNNVLLDFNDAYKEYESCVVRFASQKSIAKTLRLHYWFYPEEYIKVLRRNGVGSILVKEEQIIEVTGLQTWETNVRIENETMKSILYKIFHHLKRNEKPLVIFTHEWALNRKNKVKLLIVVMIIWLLRYKFICE